MVHFNVVHEATGRKIAAVWGKEKEKYDTGALIVKAVNLHHELVAALRKIADGPLTIAASPDVVSAVQDYRELVSDMARAVLDKVDAP